MDVPSEGSIDRLDRGVSLWEFAQEIGVAESFHIRERDVDGMFQKTEDLYFKMTSNNPITSTEMENAWMLG